MDDRADDEVILSAEKIRIAYEGQDVVRDVDIRVPKASFTVLVGPNGSGKTTALRALSGGVRLSSGQVRLAGRPVAGMAPRRLARELTMLPQAPSAPPSTTVAELVSRGRAPYQSLLRQRSREDEYAIERALAATGMSELASRAVDQLSGGQRQRAWLAMALAQDTPLILLDEPTTYLDVTHQVEILDLCRDLQHAGRTLVLVLHDLNLAARYATQMIVFCQGRVVADGRPGEILDAQLMKNAFGLDCHVLPDPVTGTPLVVPEPPRAPRPGAVNLPSKRK